MSSQIRTRHDSMQSNASLNWNRPPSPTFSTTTTGSKVNLSESHSLISRKDLRASIACFEDLMAAAKAYRNALLAMSTATAAFASAMEACSRVKGCRGANAALAGGAGLQYLISNHEQLLADTVYRQFEIPLLEALDNYKMLTQDRLVSYEKQLHAQSDKIRKTEAENMKIGRRRKRDLQQFRSALAALQAQVDELDAIKLAYHEEVLDAEEETWDTVLSKVAFVVRSQLDFYEKIAGKASDPVLEPLVMSIPDPFDTYGPPKEEGQIFSVLAPLHLDSQSPPTPNLTRISQSGSLSSTPRVSSPSKLGVPVARPATSVSAIEAVAERGSWDETDRAHRELSVIDEREGSPARTLSALRSEINDDEENEENAEDVGETPTEATGESAPETKDSAARSGDDLDESRSKTPNGIHKTPLGDGTPEANHDSDRDAPTVNDDHGPSSSEEDPDSPRKGDTLPLTGVEVTA